MKQYQSVECLLHALMKTPVLRGDRDESLLEWYRRLRLDGDSVVSEDLIALQGGFYANSVGQAFIYGYEIAIQRLTGLDTKDQLAAFCVTENKSTHPKSMQVSLSKGQQGKVLLAGKKDFVTLAGSTKWLLVAAKSAVSSDGRNQIKLVKVDASLPGVDIETLPLLPFVPDVSHGVVTFDSVSIDESDVFSGDGYGDYVKPFRWFEDVNVFIALSGYLLKIAITNQWPVESRVEIISILTALIGMQRMEADEPVAHIVMFDQVTRLERWLDRYDQAWGSVDSSVAVAWKRDKGILKIASHARSVRYAKALSRMRLA